MFGDLHFHSRNSDGNKTPEERILQIRKLDPSNEGIWAMTDHDKFSENFISPARDTGIKAIWATEISAHSNELDCSFHVTCYSPALSANIKKHIDAVLIGKTGKVQQQVGKLHSKGFDITESEFFLWIELNGYQRTAVSNAHIANFLFQTNKKSTLKILQNLTNGKVTDEGGFIIQCLQEGGGYSNIGHVVVPRYEPEIRDIIKVAESENIVLSVAHPNFSFNKLYTAKGINRDAISRSEYFKNKILPILLDIGMKNYEINAKASPKEVEYLSQLVKRTGGMNTYGSDNHGSDREDNKHGIFGVQNPLLTEEMVGKTKKKLLEFT